MTEQATTADLTVAFTKAWSSGDMDAVGRLVTADIVFESPMARLTGVEDPREGRRVLPHIRC